jgi:hypothetical protein
VTAPMTPEVVPAHQIRDGIEVEGWAVLFQTFDNPDIRQDFFDTEDQATRWARWLGARQQREVTA